MKIRLEKNREAKTGTLYASARRGHLIRLSADPQLPGQYPDTTQITKRP